MLYSLLKRAMVAMSAVLVVGSAPASAALVTYTDKSLWEAALGAVSSKDFASVNTNINLNNTSYSLGELTFSGVVFGTYDSAQINSSGYLDLDGFDGTDSATVSASPSVIAMGFGYWGHDASSDLLRVSVGGVSVAALANTLGSGQFFFGIIDTSGSALGDMTFTGTGGMYARIDSFHWAREGISAVPVPASLPLLLIGVAGFGIAAKRKRIQ